MLVGKPRINYICLKKKGKNQLTLCSIKLTWSLVVFHLAWNGSATKKLWLGLQFCHLLQDLQLQYLRMFGNISSMLIIGGNFININFTFFCRSKVSFGIQQRSKSGGSQQSFIQGGSTPRSNPLPSYIYHFWQKRYPFRIPSNGSGTSLTCLV